MDIVSIVLIAIGLSMDALAVAIAKGVTVKEKRNSSALLLASFFGGFQALMPVLGWLAGIGLKEFIMGIDHWIAFGLLVIIGAKMIYESRKKEKDEVSRLTLSVALLLAVATSIDALMVGLTFAFLETSIIIPALIIGSITFVLSYIGFMSGSKLGTIFGKRIEMLGGIILILIGIRILVEHMA